MRIIACNSNLQNRIRYFFSKNTYKYPQADLGKNFGANLTEREVNWLIENEFARTAEDIVWRRSKLGLRLTTQEIDVLDAWLAKAPATSSQQHAV